MEASGVAGKEKGERSRVRRVGARKQARNPFVFGKLFRFNLRDFILSMWPLLMLLALVGAHLFLLTDTPGRQHFFGVHYALSMVLAVIASVGFFSRANRAETYSILARPVSRTTLTATLLLGAWLVTVAGYLISSVAVLVRFGPWLHKDNPVTSWLDARALAQGSLPVLLVALAVVSFVGLLSTFVAPTGLRLAILALAALMVMAFDSRNFPFEGLRPLLQQLPPIMAPFAGALRFATEANPDTQATYSLGALGAYAGAFTLLVMSLTSGRETVLE